MKMLATVCFATSLMSTIMAPHALAQGSGSGPVRVLTPQAPGSASDLVSRGIAEALSKALGQAVIVENRPGASGLIAGQACAQAAPDGHTFCLLDASNAALGPALFKTMPFQPKDDLVPVVLVGFFPAGLFVNKSVAAKSINALLETGKTNPGKLNFATFGAATSSSIYAAWLKNVRGSDFTNVSYKSALEALRAVVTGEADIGYTNVGAAAANSKPEDLRLLAVNNPSRLPEFPDVPTFAEANINAAATWFGLFAPKGTKPDLTERINAEVIKGLINNPDMRKRFLDTSGVVPTAPAAGSPASFATFFDSELVVYDKLVKEAKIEKLDR